MKRNKLQKTVFSVICIVLAVIMMLSLVITVLPAHAVDETDLERLAEKRAQLEEQLMEQEQVIQGLTENQTLIVFRKAALDKQISLNRETIALIEEQIAVYQEIIDRKEEEVAAATAAETEETALLRERIRNERCVELAFEGHHYYYDIRRWKIAPQTMTQTLMGIYIEKVDVSNEYPRGRRYVRQPIPNNRQANWKNAMYYLPFPAAEANKMKNFVNNELW